MILFCEKLRHPHLFGIGKSEFQARRKILLTESKYFDLILIEILKEIYFNRDFLLILIRCYLHTQSYKKLIVTSR